MTSEEFRQLLQERSDVQLLDPCLHDEEAPYVFQANAAAWESFRDELATLLGVGRSDVRIVGSGRFGFSLKPWNNFKGFGDKSDIDVVIVNANLFDELWVALLDAAYPRSPILEKLGGWLQKRRNELYTGWLTPLKIHLDYSIVGSKARPVLDFRTRWFNALKQASRHPTRRHEDITGRLYRTWRHAELYHLNSLSELRRALNA